MMPVLVPDMPSADDLLPYLRRIDASKWYSNYGPLNAELTERLTGHFGGASHIVTCSNATAGLEMVLEEFASQRPRTTDVVLPALTFPATATAVLRAGLQPVFCDVNAETWQATAANIMPLIGYDVSTRLTAAFLPVCAFGAERVEENDLSSFGIQTLTDAAAAFGNQLSVPYAAVFSMHATKAFGCGEGGFLATTDAALAKRFMLRTKFGLREAGDASVIGNSTNAKLSEYHAAVALAAMDRWNETSSKRQRVAAWYLERLLALPVVMQQRPDDDIRTTMECLLPVGVDVEVVRARLHLKGIATRRWYFPPLHWHSVFSRTTTLWLPVTEDIATRLIGLPFHTFLTEHDVDRVCAELREAIT